VNEEAMACVGSQRHSNKKKEFKIVLAWLMDSLVVMFNVIIYFHVIFVEGRET
jgi:hypothetical protein